MAGATHLTDANFEKTVKEAGMPVFVDFFAEWCGPCKLAAPIVEKLAPEMAGKVLVTKVDVDENHDTAVKYGVMSIPTVVILQADKNGEIKELDRKIGFPGEEGYRQMLAKVS
jgi:thioredoxin 1